MSKYTFRDVFALFTIWILVFQSFFPAQSLTVSSDPVLTPTGINADLSFANSITGSGTTVYIEIDGEDGDLHVFEETLPVDKELSLSFEQHGFKNIHLTYLDSLDAYSMLEENFYVGSLITEVKLDNGTGQVEVPLPTPVPTTVVYCATFENGSDVDIDFLLLGNPDSARQILDAANATALNCVEWPGSYFPYGLTTIEMKMTNPLGNKTEFIIVASQTDINSDTTAITLPQYPGPDGDGIIYVLVNYDLSVEFALPNTQDVTYSLTIEEDISDGALLDIVGETCTDGGGTSHTMTYKFNQTGAYLLIADMSNFMSHFSVTFKLVVLNMVNAVTATVVPNLSLHDVALDFTLTVEPSVVLEMGEVVCVFDYDDGSSTYDSAFSGAHPTFAELPGTTHTHQHTYASENLYQATMTCSNELAQNIDDIDTHLVVPLNVTILHPVENLVFSTTANLTHHGFSKIAPIIISLDDASVNLHLTNINCTSDYGQWVVGDATDVSTITHDTKFSRADDYTVNVNCSNALTYQILTFDITVYYDCWIEPIKFFVYDTTPHSKTHEQLQLTSSVLLTGNCVGNMSAVWKIFTNEVSPSLARSESVRPPNDFTKYNIPGNALDPGIYDIQLDIVIEMAIEDVFTSDFTQITMENPGLSSKITLNEKPLSQYSINMPSTDDLKFDCAASVDPAEGVPSVGGTATTCQWKCTTGAGITQAIVDTYADDGIVDTAVMNEDCTSELSGSTGTAVTVTGGRFIPQRIYIVELTYSRTDRTSTSFIAITPIVGGSLQPFINCSGCEPAKSDLNKVKLTDSGYQACVDIGVDLVTQEVHTIVYAWKLEEYDVSLGEYKQSDIAIEHDKRCITITSDQFKTTTAVKFQLSCELSASGYPPERAIRHLIKNLEPYDGTCTTTLPDDGKVTAAKTELLVTCANWKDEGDSDGVRNITTDTGNGLTYQAKMYYLNETGHRNTSYEPISLLKEPSVSSELKFTLRMPPDGIIHVELEVCVLDSYLSQATVVIGQVEVDRPIANDVSGDGGAALVEDFASSFTVEIANAESLGDITLLGSVLALVSSCLPDIPQPPPAIPTSSGVSELDLGDLNAEEPVAPEAAMQNVFKTEPDAALVAVQEIKKDQVTKLATAFDAQSSSLADNPQQALSVIQSATAVADVPTDAFTKDAQATLTSMAQNVYAVTKEMAGSKSGVAVQQVQAATMGVTLVVAKQLTPTESFQTADAADVRASQEKQMLIASDEVTANLEDSLMTPEERVFYQLSRLKKNMVKGENMLDNLYAFDASKRAHMKNTMGQINLVDGGSTTIGTPDSSLMVTKLPASELAKATITNDEVALKASGLKGVTGSPKIAINNLKTVTSVDEEGTFKQITSKQTTILMETEDEVSGVIMMSNKVNMGNPNTIVAEPDPLDPSNFITVLVLCEEGQDMLIQAQPNTAAHEIDQIFVYIQGRTESNAISIENYDNVLEAFEEDRYYVQFIAGSFTCTGAVRVAYQFKMKDQSPSARRRRAAAQGSNIPTFNSTTTSMACMTFDDSTNKWRTDECTGTWNPSTGELDCACKPKKELTFATSFYVPPNTIDFSNVFLKFSPLNQAAVMAVLILILIIYIVVVIWARRQDRKDLLKWGITPLSDNFSEDNYFYVIKVFTGIRPGAGTRSRVSMVIAGEDMDTGVRELADGVRDEFVTGSVMNFLMSTSGYLGDLDYTRIWHDNSGSGNSASWYLSKIEIHDIQRNEVFVFMSERWLAVEKEDGLLECVLPVCKTENLNKFSNRFFLNAKDNLAESHIWVSVAYRPQASNFTRIQRASCALLFVMLTMIANAMFFKTSDEGNYETPSELQVGPFRFSLQQVYTSVISALIVTPPTILVIYLFKLAKNKLNPHETLYKPRNRARQGRYKVPFMSEWLEQEQKRSMELEKHLVTKGIPANSGFRFPHWVAYVAWFLIVSGSFLSAFFVMLFSMEWGKQKSEEWITTFIMSFVESVFCLDPVKVGIMALVFALIFRSTQESEAPVDRSTIMKNYSSSLRTQSGGTRLPAPPLDNKKLEKARGVRQREMLMKTAFRDIIVNIVMIWILFSISYSNADTRSYDMLQEVTNKLLDPVNLPQFTKIRSINEYFDWLRNTTIPNLFPETEIDGNQTALHWRLRQFIQGGALFRVGPPRLRQVRTTKKTCHNPYFETEDCFTKYTTPSEDDGSYCLGWKNGKCSDDEILYKFSSDAWKFTSALDVWGMPITGYYTTYGGGGYIAKLAVNRQVSDLILDELYDFSWIDRQTRSVLFEFTLYCLNTNIFTYNMFMVEFPETGGAFPYYNIIPLKVYQHLGTMGMYTLLCEIIFVLYQIFCTISMIVMIVQQKKAFFKKPWQVYDFLFTFLGYVAIIMYVIRYVFVDMSLDVFRADKKEFVNFYHIALWNQSFVLLMGVLVFMATLRMLNILGYNKRISALARVFTEAANELVWFGIFFLYVFTCYSAFGFLLFGSKLKSYMNVFKAMGTLFISMIGKSRFTEIDNTDPVMSKIYFIIFIFFVVYMILTMFLAILSKAIDEVHADTKKDKGDEMVDYVIKKVSGYLSYGSRSRTPTVKPTSKRLVSATANKRKFNMTDLSKMDHREILQEIRQSMNEALTSNPRDFSTPCEERKEKKVTFRR